MFKKILRSMTIGRDNSRVPPSEAVQDLERRFRELDGLSFKEVDAKLGVKTSNRNASGRGYLSPRFYKRIPIETAEKKKKRSEKVARLLSRKG